MRAAAVVVSALALGWADVSHANAPSCRTTVRVEPEEPFAGQQVIYSVVIERRDNTTTAEWVVPLSFPDFRAEQLPGRPEEVAATDDGGRWLTRTLQRALFAPLAGDFEIPSATLLCVVSPPGRNAWSEAAIVPAIRVRVQAPPAEGRPEGWRGLVGPIQAQVVADLTSPRLGASVQLSVLLRGAANLWDAAPPQIEDRLEGRTEGEGSGLFEVLERPPELRLDAGARLYARRFFRFDLIPHETGHYRLNPLSFAYYDPEQRRYAVARTQPIEIDVRPRFDHSRSNADQRVGGGRKARPPAGGSAPRLGTVLIAITVVAGGFAARAWRRRRVSERRGVETALTAAEAAATAGDVAGEAAALCRAIRLALAACAPTLVSNDPGEIGSDVGAPTTVRAAANALAALERQRFSRQADGATTPDRSTVARLVRELLGR